MVRAGCVFIAGIHPSMTWTSGSFESVRWNACVHRLDLGLYSHPKEFFGGNGVWTHVNSKGKIPSTGKCPQRRIEHATLWTASPNTTNELFRPQKVYEGFDKLSVYDRMVVKRLLGQLNKFTPPPPLQLLQSYVYSLYFYTQVRSTQLPILLVHCLDQALCWMTGNKSLIQQSTMHDVLISMQIATNCFNFLQFIISIKYITPSGRSIQDVKVIALLERRI